MTTTQPYRYRSTSPSTRHVVNTFHNVRKLGRLLSVKGYRFTSTRTAKGYGHGFTSTHEYVLVTGENGTARFGSLSWGFSGNGPRALIELLELCGVPNSEASDIGYHAPRKDHPGTDWELDLTLYGGNTPATRTPLYERQKMVAEKWVESLPWKDLDGFDPGWNVDGRYWSKRVYWLSKDGGESRLGSVGIQFLGHTHLIVETWQQ
jgi:hypothetical protein